MSAKPIFAEKEDCKKNWHEIPADFSIKVFVHARLRQKQKTVSLNIARIAKLPYLMSELYKMSFEGR